MNETVTPRDDPGERISVLLVRRARLRQQLGETEAELDRLERRIATSPDLTAEIRVQLEEIERISRSPKTTPSQRADLLHEYKLLLCKLSEYLT